MCQGSATSSSRYFLQKVRLGQGSFGTVWRAIDRRTGNVVAMKLLDKAHLKRQGQRREDIDREVALIRDCAHENVLQLLDVFEDCNSVHLAQEYCDGGDFADKLRERGFTIRESEAAEWMRQISAAVASLHDKQVCHRDIKPENFLVASAPGGGSNGILKLADFGFATHVVAPRGQAPAPTVLTAVPPPLLQKCGTPAFMAPELLGLPLRSHGYGLAVDVWAAGVSMYQVLFGSLHPFLDEQGRLREQEIFAGALDFRPRCAEAFLRPSGSIGRLPVRFSEEVQQLCRAMIEVDPAKRLSAKDVCNSTWIKKLAASAQLALQQQSGEEGFVSSSYNLQEAHKQHMEQGCVSTMRMSQKDTSCNQSVSSAYNPMSCARSSGRSPPPCQNSCRTERNANTRDRFLSWPQQPSQWRPAAGTTGTSAGQQQQPRHSAASKGAPEDPSTTATTAATSQASAASSATSDAIAALAQGLVDSTTEITAAALGAWTFLSKQGCRMDRDGPKRNALGLSRGGSVLSPRQQESTTSKVSMTPRHPRSVPSPPPLPVAPSWVYATSPRQSERLW